MYPRFSEINVKEALSDTPVVFVMGPRQVGKTTTCQTHVDTYLNWDNIDDREQILAGPAKVVDRLQLNQLTSTTPVALFDELHKYPRWKQFLKGFFDMQK